MASRCLDVRGVGLVVNFDPPRSPEDYVHRIGRTGRAGDSGLAISILSGNDTDAARYIAAVVRRTGVRMPPQLALRLSGGGQPEHVPGPEREPRAPWREPWDGLGAKRLKLQEGDLASAVSKLWP